MENDRVSPSHFGRVHEELAEGVTKRLRDFLERPSEKNTHELRAVIRRLEASMSVLPKDVRKEGAIMEYRRHCEKVLKTTSKIRNCDILENKLARRKEDLGVAEIRKQIRKSREKSVRRSMKAGRKLSEVREPRMNKKALAGYGAGLRKNLDGLDGVISKELSLVLKDEAKSEELHSLRINCKKFRYILELMPKDSFSLEAIELLRRWQDRLGEIRDSDVMIGYLEGPKNPKYTLPLLSAERALRHKRYMAFVKSEGGARGKRSSFVTLARIK